MFILPAQAHRDVGNAGQLVVRRPAPCRVCRVNQFLVGHLPCAAIVPAHNEIIRVRRLIRRGIAVDNISRILAVLDGDAVQRRFLAVDDDPGQRVAMAVRQRIDEVQIFVRIAVGIPIYQMARARHLTETDGSRNVAANLDLGLQAGFLSLPFRCQQACQQVDTDGNDGFQDRTENGRTRQQRSGC